MKKNWKQFWTLNRHHAEGFTLVELIVVIAILAILSAVAIPAYSGYINKTHMTTDQKLVSEVADALTLFYYANPNAGSAFVVLTPDGAYADNDPASISNGEKAMEAVFGSGWTNTSLSYAKWDESDNGMLGAAQQGGSAVLNSSFLQGSSRDELLANVSNLTFAASGFVGQIGDPTLVYSGMVGNFAGGDAEEFDKLCQQYGIETTGEGSNKQFAAGVTNTQISNLMVAAAAKSFSSGQDTTASNLVLMYAGYTAAVNSPTATQADKDNFAAMNAAFQNASSVADVQAALDNFRANSGTLVDTWENSSQAETDSEAIMALMNAVNTAAGKMDANDMNDANLFTTGKAANAFNTYVSAAEAMAELGTVPPNSIAVFLNADTGIPEIFCSNDAAFLQK